MASIDFDAIVIGGRIAGAMVAGLLSRAGFSVLVVDQVTFPRDAISAPILYGNALQLLDAIGAETAIAACRFPKIRRVRKVSPDRTVVGYLLPIGGRDYAYGVTRDQLDTALLNYICSFPGVTVREGFNVRRVLWEGQRVVGIEGYSQHHSSHPERFYADIVIGADGIHSFTARQVNAPIYRSDPPTHFQYYAFFEQFESSGQPELLLHSPSIDQSLLTFEVAQDLTAISWSPVVDRLPAVRGRAEAAFTEAWQSVPELRERGRLARRATKLMGRLPTPSFFRQPWGLGWALIGDAALHTDPSGGRGFYDACRSAELLAHAFTQYRRGRPWNEAMHVFHVARDFECDSSYRYIRSMADRQAPVSAALRFLIEAAAEDQGLAEIWLSLNKALPVAAVVDPLDLSLRLPTQIANTGMS